MVIELDGVEQRPNGLFHALQPSQALQLYPGGILFQHRMRVGAKQVLFGEQQNKGAMVCTSAKDRSSIELWSIHDTWYPRTLIVCPGTLIQNWKSELESWGWWHVKLFHGDRKEALQSARAGRLVNSSTIQPQRKRESRSCIKVRQGRKGNRDMYKANESRS